MNTSITNFSIYDYNLKKNPKLSSMQNNIMQKFEQPKQDLFIHSATSSTEDKLKEGVAILGSIFGKVKAKVSDAIDNVLYQDAFKNNVQAIKLAKTFVDNGTFDSYQDAINHKDVLIELSKLDYNNLMKKYDTIVRHAKTKGAKHPSTDWNYLVGFNNIYDVLSYEKLQSEDILAIYNIFESRGKENLTQEGDYLRCLTDTLQAYENFDNLSASEQKHLLRICGYTFGCSSNITKKEADAIPEYSTLTKFEYVKDLKEAKDEKELTNMLNEQRKNIPCKAITVPSANIEKVVSANSLTNLQNALENTDLKKYYHGFELEYSRKDFINDFEGLIKDLSNEDKKKIFELFQFKIDSAKDIVNYPNPNFDLESVDESIKPVVSKVLEITNRFMFENHIKLEPEDKALEIELNNIIKAFPEFISVIGKQQHRGDSIDFHTMDDMKRIMSDPEYQKLPDSEKRIMAIVTLFHDFGKAEGVVDTGHAKKSAIAAKEIIKKTNLTLDEKERIYNLINHSHWLVEGLTEDRMAFIFRRPNDLKMAEIFEKADSNSSGFNYAPSQEKMKAVKNQIDKINSAGIPLFADQLPTDDKFYEKTANGVRYLDLRDPEASVEKYGYPKGTKVKDLKFLCHSSSDNYKDFSAICDDSKEVCLSTSLLNKEKNFVTGYNYNGHYIISGSNANIICGSKDMTCSGGHRGFEYAMDVAEQRHPDSHMPSYSSYGGSEETFIKNRKNVSDKIKAKLDLNDNEYKELFENICNLNKLEEISDYTLETGKTVRKEEIQIAIKEIQSEMVRPKRKDEGGYTNEFVIFNPKIEAQVLGGMTPEDLEAMNYTEQKFVLI